MVYNKYNYMYPDVQKVQQELESDFIKQQANVDKEAEILYKNSPEQAIFYLTNYSDKSAELAFNKWKKLGEFLTIKYMDGIVRKEKDGQFIKNEYDKPSGPDRVGYSKKYYENIAKETGSRYKSL